MWRLWKLKGKPHRAIENIQWSFFIYSLLGCLGKAIREANLRFLSPRLYCAIKTPIRLAVWDGVGVLLLDLK